MSDQPEHTVFAISVVDSAGDTAFKPDHDRSIRSSDHDRDQRRDDPGVSCERVHRGEPHRDRRVVSEAQWQRGHRPARSRPAGRRSGRSKREAGTKSPLARPTGQPGQNQYVVWNVDSNGNYISNATGILSGTNAQELAGLEAAFGELGNNGQFFGRPPATATPIVSNATTTLAELEVGGLSQNGDAYELNPLGGTGGPLLELNGSVVTKGQFRGRLDAGRGATDGKWVRSRLQSTAGTVCGLEHRQQRRLTPATPRGSLSGTQPGACGGGSRLRRRTFAGAGVAPATPNAIATNATTTLAELEVSGIRRMATRTN